MNYCLSVMSGMLLASLQTGACLSDASTLNPIPVLSMTTWVSAGAGILIAFATIGLWSWARFSRKAVLQEKQSDGTGGGGIYRGYFDNMPGQVFIEDCSALSPVFTRLREAGVIDFGIHLRSHPELELELISMIRLVAANRSAFTSLDCATLAELQTKVAGPDSSPYRAILRFQLMDLWNGLRAMEQEIQYRDGRDNERACLVRCTVPERLAQADWSCIELVVMDVSAAKWTSVAKAGDQELLRQILAGANILLWWAKVWYDNGRYVWKLSVPPQSFDSPLFKLATAIDMGGLWDPEHVPDWAEIVNRSDQALRNNLRGYQQEFRVIHDRKTHWLSEDVGIQQINQNEWHLSGVVVDITPRHEAEEARQKTEAHLQQILSRADCMLWQAHVSESSDGDLIWSLYCPQSVLRTEIFGEKAAANSGLLWYTLDIPEYAEMNARSTHALRTNASGYEQEFRVQNTDRTLWLHENVSIKPAGPGRWNLVGVLTDISDRRRAEQELAAEKERLSVTLKAMGEGVITTDVDGCIQFINPSAASLLNIPAADLVRRRLMDLLILQNGATGTPIESPVATVLREGVLVELPLHTVLRSRDESVHMVEGCCAPVHDAESRTIGAVLVLRDVTDRNRLEDELQRASRMESIGILAGGIAHDFNNILTAVMGNLTLARLDSESLPAIQESLDEAQKAVIRARDLTQQLLTFAKGGDPVRAAVQLKEVVTEVARFALHGSKVKCNFDLAVDLWPANADKGQVGQVVQNLVINAIQAMPQGGNMRIGACNKTVRMGMPLPLTPGCYVRISVEDTGRGIKAEHLSRIFDPFYTTKQQGSGLGLATAYSIVKKHKGHIEVDSELTRGTVFHVWLPALPDARIEETEGDKSISERLTGRILFMDDEEPIRRMASILLKRLGLEVHEVEDGARAIEAYTKARELGTPFDLVIMDLTVPGGMGGAEAMQELRRFDPAIKAIVSSGYSRNPILANYRDHGFMGMVVKPYEVKDLFSIVREVLGK